MRICEIEEAGRALFVGNFLSGSVSNRSVCEELSDRLMHAGWEIYRASQKSNRLARLVDMAKTTWLNRFRYDVAHIDVFSGPAFLWAETVCWILRRAGKPYALTLHGGNLPDFSLLQPERVKRLLRSAAVVTAPSRYLKTAMRAYRRDITLIPNALDTDLYAFRLREHPEPKLVWIRAFHDIYSPQLAPVIVSLLKGEFPSIQLLMVGQDKRDGSLERTKEMIKKLDVSGQVTIGPGVPKTEIPLWMNKGDIFLNTSRIDNTPVTVVEAMACGLCVVSTDAGGVPYLLSDGEDGLVVPKGNPEGMASAVRRILREPELGRRLSEKARLQSETFDWSIVLPAWESLLRGVSRNGNKQKKMRSSQ